MTKKKERPQAELAFAEANPEYYRELIDSVNRPNRDGNEPALKVSFHVSANGDLGATKHYIYGDEMVTVRGISDGLVWM